MGTRPLDSTSWAEVEPYLDQALDLDPQTRETWLTDLATTEPGIAQTLRTLLQERESLDAAGFLDQPLLATDKDLTPEIKQALAQLPTQSDEQAASHPLREVSDAILEIARARAERLQAFDLAPEKVVGPYRLIREIGYGGMSSVWLAQHSDGGIKREVALKLPLTHQRFHLERFLRERDLLAALTHPNIARLYDAGVAESGQPYLAMEFIAGIAITQACDQRQATLRERLQLFMQALEAVQFAHAQLIMHRDLKPSNILVTPEGRVVLVDFGIGKLLSEGTQHTPLTELFGRPLTPSYSSPEQIAGQSLSTASDIYSLGVILYELLAGTLPYDLKRNSRAALEEAVLTGDLRPPGQRDFTAQSAAARKSSARALKSTLAGDLDTITLKALKRDPAGRYASVSAFAKDIDDYLHSLPISARPDSFWYRSTRFVSRHRGPVAAATLIALALTGGAVVSLWQAAKAESERDRAAALAERNEATNQFLGTLITEAAASATPVSVSDMLARSERLATRDTTGPSENRAAVLAMLGSYYNSLGNVERSAQLHERALALLENSTDTDLRSQITCSHARAISYLGRYGEAKQELDREIAALTSSPAIAALCLHSRVSVAKRAGDAKGALRYALLALQRFHESGGGRLIDEGIVLGAVADGYTLNGRHAEAREYFQQALQKYNAAGSRTEMAPLVLRGDWAMLESASGNPRKALQLYDEVQQAMAEYDTHPHLPAVLIQNRARMQHLLGRYEQARASYESALQIAVDEGNQAIRTNTLINLAQLTVDTADREATVRYLQMADASLDASLPASNPMSIGRKLVQGRLDLLDGKFDQAREDFAQVLAFKKGDAKTVDAALGRAEAELLSGDLAAATVDARFALATAQSLQAGAPFSNRTGLAWLMLARTLQQQGNVSKARAASTAAIEHLSQTVDADHPALARSRQLLAEVSG